MARVLGLEIGADGYLSKPFSTNVSTRAQGHSVKLQVSNTGSGIPP